MSRRGTPETEVVIDMTPMIDVTFLMIIFFIIVNDLSQQDLEDLKLPVALEAGHDDPPPGRPILNVMPDGTIIYKKHKLYFPGMDTGGRIDPIRKGKPDYYWKLAEKLADLARYMKKEADPDFPKLGELPDEPILIRADRNTEFKYIARIMETCSRQDIRIWRVQLAASEPEQNK